jgi:hypothetical protein
MKVLGAPLEDSSSAPDWDAAPAAATKQAPDATGYSRAKLGSFR